MGLTTTRGAAGSRRDALFDRPGARRRDRHHGEGSTGCSKLLPGLSGSVHVGPDGGEGCVGESSIRPNTASVKPHHVTLRVNQKE